MSVTRHAGVLLPLFSASSSSSWGIGELADIAPLAAWLGRAGFDRLMLLPIGPMAEGGTSPYSASSAMAIDPIFIAVEHLEDFVRAGGIEALPAETRDELAALRTTTHVDHAVIRRVKQAALDRAFNRFIAEEWELLTLRGSKLARYIANERWWLDDYALFRAIDAEAGGRPWREWPAPLAERHPDALDDARRRMKREVLRHQYLQWTAETQWRAAREAAHAAGVTVFGDVPFMVMEHSADVWVRAREFWIDATVGAPPDPFSATGQDWGMPVYRWDVIAEGGYAWMRERARRMAALYDGFRIDHIIGFYRTYARPKQGDPFFIPADEPAQLEQGETLLRIFLGAAGLTADGLNAAGLTADGLNAAGRPETGAVVIAEDLGVLPHFLRPSLDRLGVPGYRVLRWERAWHEPGAPFLDPRGYPPRSAAATGTHDTETLAAWWDGLGADDQGVLRELLSQMSIAVREDPGAPVTLAVPAVPAMIDALLEATYAAASDDLFIPMQDLFGWRERINTPATIGPDNWTWRLPWPADRLLEIPEAASRAHFLRELARATGRC
jgi:4-alpha-glucanotransferase